MELITAPQRRHTAGDGRVQLGVRTQIPHVVRHLYAILRRRNRCHDFNLPCLLTVMF